MAVGIPSLGPRAGSASDHVVNRCHDPALSVTTMNLNPLTIFQGLRLREVWGHVFSSQRASCASASDIHGLVRFILEDVKALASEQLPGMNLGLSNALSVFQVRADIWVVTKAEVPVGVVQVNQPPLGSGDPDAALSDTSLAGELLDYLLRLKTFYGLRHCFGIATNYLSWKVFWLPSDETDKIAAATKIWLCS